MSDAALNPTKLARLDERLTAHAGHDVPGLAWAVARGDRVHVGTAGRMAEGGRPVARDSIFRISSLTKPVTAVAALILVEEGVLPLDGPIDPWLPELADRRVLAEPAGPLDRTVPAERPLTVRDLLTFRMGIGMDFTAPHQPVLQAAAEAGLGAGPPAPASRPDADEFLRRLGALPLERQPGERWLYHTSADVLGALVGRAAGRPLDVFLHERVFEPLGMVDTGFSVPAADLDRFGPHHAVDPATGRPGVYDEADGQWAAPPAFPGGGDGLVSTVDDLLAFAAMLRAGGRHPGGRILARPTVGLMTANQLTPDQLVSSSPDPSGAIGWGFGVGVIVARTSFPSVGAYGWDGGLGSTWANDPAEDLTGIVLTNQAWTSPLRPALYDQFWGCAFAAVDP